VELYIPETVAAGDLCVSSQLQYALPSQNWQRLVQLLSCTAPWEDPALLFPWRRRRHSEHGGVSSLPVLALVLRQNPSLPSVCLPSAGACRASASSPLPWVAAGAVHTRRCKQVS